MGSFLAGNLGLAKTFWIFGVVGSFIVNFILSFMIISGIPLIGVLILGLSYSIIVWIAIWNSANKYEGLKLWAILARISVILGILGTLGTLGQLF